MKWWKQTIRNYGLLFAIIAAAAAPGFFVAAIAQAAPTYTSPNYGVDEVFMGAGGLNDASSTSYRARASLGDLAAGNSSSTNYQVYGGFTTTPDPYIEMVVTNADIDLGYLSTSSAATTTTTFSVRTYLASGYVAVNASDPPRATSGAGSHTLTNLTSQTASSTGTEQFGINLVANTAPTTFGANPVQVPSGSYSYGQAATGYNTTNQYKYIKGDTIASSTQSSGVTQYTVSYLYNIETATPAGEYVFDHVIVATSTF